MDRQHLTYALGDLVLGVVDSRSCWRCLLVRGLLTFPQESNFIPCMLSRSVPPYNNPKPKSDQSAKKPNRWDARDGMICKASKLKFGARRYVPILGTAQPCQSPSICGWKTDEIDSTRGKGQIGRLTLLTS